MLRYHAIALLTLDLVACGTTPQVSQVESPPAAATSAAPSSISANHPSATVISVGDGDTIRESERRQHHSSYGLY